MCVLGNILWFILGGFVMGLAWWFFGALAFISIIGIPLGIQAFKMAKLALWPFGAEIANL